MFEVVLSLEKDVSIVEPKAGPPGHASQTLPVFVLTTSFVYVCFGCLCYRLPGSLVVTLATHRAGVQSTFTVHAIRWAA